MGLVAGRWTAPGQWTVDGERCPAISCGDDDALARTAGERPGAQQRRMQLCRSLLFVSFQKRNQIRQWRMVALRDHSREPTIGLIKGDKLALDSQHKAAD